ncbi:unnamed protein product, partial [Closterium sp. NIES-54]
EKVRREEGIPANLKEQAEEKRHELIEHLSEVDDEVAEKFLNDESISAEELQAAVRRATLALKFVPVFMGSAFKNRVSGEWWKVV